MGTGGGGKTLVAVLTVAAALAISGGAAAPAVAAAANPTPLTDLGASLLPFVTGGTQRVCAVSGKGIAVHCVDRVSTLPSADQAATADTLGHWIFCRTQCSGSLLVHELVHVRQFETYGDAFGPMYILEAVLHGDGCANQWERPAYQATGGC